MEVQNIWLATVTDDRGDRHEVELLEGPSMMSELSLGFAGPDVRIKFPLDAFLAMHINGAGVFIPTRPDTLEMGISLDPAVVRDIVLALADAKRTF